MKSIKSLTLAGTLFLMAASCNTETDSVQPNQLLRAVPATFADQTSEFAFDFLKKHNAEEKADKNYFVSPLSLHVALGMLLNGADTKTKEEIQTGLRVSPDLAATNAIYKDLMDGLPNVDSKVTNTIANSVWYRNSFSVEKSFLDVLRESFNAKAYAEDFENTATVGKINNWASDNTNGKIKKVLDKIEPAHVMFLMNALYFKGDWKIPFKTANTHEENFAGTTGTNSVKMMSMTEKLKYTKRPNYQALELAYGDGNYVMTIVLPEGKTSVGEVINTMSVSEWKNLNASLTEQKVIVGLPKFTIEYETNLNNVLANMGMKTMFTDAADLSKIAQPAGKLKVGFVKQNTFVAVDEKGTEAAAVTTIGIELTSMPILPEFICNKPFAFFISEKQSNTILFAGKIVNL
ncbi:proteinase inhibitor I4 serpin [Emticicia oligotrophica DSM 17448]|uniref:Proteinase inhibitor I4 serpin n=1 Tax=Emticicia oligotrophica (strain DSM 17448 / CIP 109782 / MTCC 6937 / GPTSA100-15) TaxID=929562 RepID=A0ABN4ALC4_EMTOG|nr:serpin family protein [Emticicia oligotrophica]AFK03096.1 proteinase inhibitor I4 serpin [Emticicia oligotrophica DSM 17448]